MLDHLEVQCADVALSAAFYDMVRTGDGFREAHIAFTAADRATVDAFFAAAVGVGADVLHEPRLWPEYHPNYYGAFVRDPDGNNVEAVCHAPQ
jgi:catechol 2,3-dioxygenase-like lactoylglutathione lyase family enzyme